MFIKELTSSAGQRHPNACVPPTKGKGGNVRGWCWGAGTDYRAPLEPTLGLPGESSIIQSPKLRRSPAPRRDPAEGCNPPDRWTQSQRQGS